MTHEELLKLVSVLSQALSAQQKTVASAVERIASLERSESLLREQIALIEPDLGILTGAMKVARGMPGGKELLESIRHAALVEYPRREESGTWDAKTAARVTDFFDRVELCAQSASGKTNLN